MKKRIRVAGIIEIDGKLALIHRSKVKQSLYPDYYVIPGGGLEEGETLQQGTSREIEEELGLIVKVNEEVAFFENEKQKEYVFWCEVLEGEFGTGKGPEFTKEDSKYKEKGEYEPVLIEKEKIEGLLLIPQELKLALLEWIEKGKDKKR